MIVRLSIFDLRLSGNDMRPPKIEDRQSTTDLSRILCCGVILCLLVAEAAAQGGVAFQGADGREVVVAFDQVERQRVTGRESLEHLKGVLGAACRGEEAGAVVGWNP